MSRANDDIFASSEEEEDDYDDRAAQRARRTSADRRPITRVQIAQLQRPSPTACKLALRLLQHRLAPWVSSNSRPCHATLLSPDISPGRRLMTRTGVQWRRRLWNAITNTSTVSAEPRSHETLVQDTGDEAEGIQWRVFVYGCEPQRPP